MNTAMQPQSDVILGGGRDAPVETYVVDEPESNRDTDSIRPPMKVALCACFAPSEKLGDQVRLRVPGKRLRTSTTWGTPGFAVFRYQNGAVRLNGAAPSTRGIYQ